MAALGKTSLAGIARVAIVLTMFIAVPVGVWWVAMPMISSLPLSANIQRLLTFMVLGTLAFGGASGFLVLKSMAEEP